MIAWAVVERVIDADGEVIKIVSGVIVMYVVVVVIVLVDAGEPKEIVIEIVIGENVVGGVWSLPSLRL